jgi:cytoskeletal protein RodZ
MKTKNAPATESGDPVGSQLSVARLRLGWTLEEASARTRLHHNILRQLEAGQFDKLPSLAYTRGFLRIYSRELGLDPKTLLREFQPSAEREDSILDLRPEMLEALPTRASEPIFTSRGLGLGVLSIAGLFILAVATIQIYRVWPVKSAKDPSTLAPIGANEKNNSTPSPTPSTTPDGPVKSALPATSTQPSPSSLPSVQASATPTPKPATPQLLRIRAKKDTWVRVVAIRDGQEIQLFEDTIDEDDTLPDKDDPAWSGDSFVVTTREAADAEIIFNESNFGAYEKSGPQTFSLPAR